MTTGQNIHDNLPIPAATTAQTLLALKAATWSAWPMVRINEYKTSVATLSANTYEYSLSAISDLTREEGVSRVFVTATTSEPKTLVRAVRQRYVQDSAAWYLIFTAPFVTAYSGQPVHIEYQRRPAAPSAIGDTLEIPEEFAYWYAIHWYATRGIAEPHVDSRSSESLSVTAREQLDAARKRAWTQPMMRTTPIFKDRED
jgi:hypothetical protein